MPSSHINSKPVIAALLIAQLIGIALFARGFFPQKNALEGFAEWSDSRPPLLLEDSSSSDTPNPSFGRLILVMVDALRHDFVFEMDSMRYLRSVVSQGKALPFVSKAHAPTVTMPRIKALLTGGIPGFLDFVLNFFSSSLLEDNLIAQFHQKGKRMVFYGDDTWLKLFPDHFVREEGTSSFYVSDYTEVDQNVTRHIGSELSKNDWDCLFLHYLGVDHIGHLEGPRSSLLPPKLEEMDGVVELLNKFVQADDLVRAERGDLPTLMVLCGDHGMNEVGNHGGSSEGEVSTTFVFLSGLFNRTLLGVDGGRVSEVNQIDLVPTLSVLFGLPIPKSSLGTFIRPFGKFLQPKRFLRELRVNAFQLLENLKMNGIGNDDDSSIVKKFEKAEKLHQRFLRKEPGVLSSVVEDAYYETMEDVSGFFTTLFSKYDLFGMTVGIAVLFGCLVLSIVMCVEFFSDVDTAEFSPSRSDGVVAFAVGGISWFVLSQACVRGSVESSLCGNFPLSFGKVAASVAFSMLAWVAVFCFKCKGNARCGTTVNSFIAHSFGRLDSALIVLCEVLHLVSLLTSSFVEEEHQTYFFFLTTLLLFYFFDTIVAFLSQSNGSVYGSFEAPSKFDVFRITFSLLSLKVLRKWNSTGDKWAGEPDIGRFLMHGENKHFLLLQVVASLVVYVVVASMGIDAVKNDSEAVRLRPMRSFPRILLLVITGLIGMYRLCQLDVLPLVDPYRVEIARLAYAAVFVLVGTSFASKGKVSNWSRTGTLIVGFIGVQLLVQRIHNMLPVSMMACVMALMSSWLLFFPRPKSLFCSILTLLWIGKFGFFAQGNSNSVATVDISGAYTGLYSFHPVAVAVQTLLIAYGLPLLAFLFISHFFNSFMDNRKLQWFKRKKEAFIDYNHFNIDVKTERIYHTCQLALTVLVIQSSILFLYSILVTLQRYHLFIWSVFSPKYLYLIVETYLQNSVLLCLFLLF